MLIQTAHVLKEKSVIPTLFAIANTSIEKSKLYKSYINPTTDFPCELPVCSSESDWEGLNTGSGKFNLRTRGSNDSLYNTV